MAASSEYSGASIRVSNQTENAYFLGGIPLLKQDLYSLRVQCQIHFLVCMTCTLYSHGVNVYS